MRSHLSGSQSQGENEPPRKTLKTYISYGISLVLLASFVLTIVCGIGKSRYTMVFFGLTFLLVGVIAFMSTQLTDRNSFILIFPVVGAAVLVISIIAMKSPKTDITPYVLLAGAGVMGVFALIEIFSVPVYRYITKKRYTYPVQAVCIELKESVTRSGAESPRMAKVFCPVFRYEYRGKEYIVDENFYTNFSVMKVGDVAEVLINERDPEDFLSRHGIRWFRRSSLQRFRLSLEPRAFMRTM